MVGGGIAGLATAWLLARGPGGTAGHRVTLFERQPRIGFTASSVSVQGVRVDVPLRVVYPGYYPTLMRLYAALGVVTEPVSYATTFSDASGRPFFRWRNLRWGGLSVPVVAPQDLLGARARRIAWGAWQLQRRLRQAQAAGALQGVGIGEFVQAERIDADCLQGLLWPALATIATCTTADAQAMPADVVAAYWGAGLARDSVRRAVDGADAVAERLMQPLGRVVCDAGVQAVVDAPEPRAQGQAEGAPGVWLHRRGHAPERFDHAVLAVTAPQALRLWPGAPAAEAELLSCFATRELSVLMHHDAQFMPAARRHWSPVHARVDPAADRPESTIWVNAVQPALRQASPVFQTVHPQRSPRAGTLLAEARFERPLVSLHSQRALAQLQARWRADAVRHTASLQGPSSTPPRRVWLAGSFAETGVPLLESAVRSAVAAASAVLGAPALGPEPR